MAERKSRKPGDYTFVNGRWIPKPTSDEPETTPPSVTPPGSASPFDRRPGGRGTDARLTAARLDELLSNLPEKDALRLAQLIQQNAERRTFRPVPVVLPPPRLSSSIPLWVYAGLALGGIGGLIAYLATSGPGDRVLDSVARFGATFAMITIPFFLIFGTVVLAQFLMRRPEDDDPDEERVHLTDPKTDENPDRYWSPD
ncbi:hypothetical protein GCM10009678_77990 [Actinomadura kijaniata]|uniref:Transmembrane protein n=1 Tax=Actinomadura namibiensis TaxID=182080 RepID=A0A7W3LVJ4_ACTNM|nr:hypothetical protein [Actinomadura namibiensis]MBA8955020.1 hypothetical protein [Actinomadura namibiensis]